MSPFVDRIKRFPWIALVVTAIPIGWFILTIVSFFVYMLVPKSGGKIAPRYVSAFSSLYSGIVCVLFVIDYWVYWRNPSSRSYHLFHLTLIQKISLITRLLIAIAFCVVAITFTVLFGVLWKRKYAADIVWTCFAIFFSLMYLTVYCVFGIRHRYMKLLDDDQVSNKTTDQNAASEMVEPEPNQ